MGLASVVSQTGSLAELTSSGKAESWKELCWDWAELLDVPYPGMLRNLRGKNQEPLKGAEGSCGCSGWCWKCPATVVTLKGEENKSVEHLKNECFRQMCVHQRDCTALLGKLRNFTGPETVILLHICFYMNNLLLRRTTNF
jgi:hypothetical protein